MQASIASRQFGLRTRRVDAGFLLGAAVAVLLLIYAVLLPLGWPANSEMSGGPGGQAIDAAAFAVVGLLIVRHQPGSPIGWMMTGSAVFLLVSADAQLYLLLDDHIRGGLPLRRLAAVLSPLWAGTIALAPALMMLFPDGRLISAGWRKAAWVSAALTAAFLVLLGLVVASALWEDPVVVSPAGDLAVVADPSGWSGTVYGVSQACLAAALLIALTSLIDRYRRVSGSQRQQIKWFVFGNALLVTTFVGLQALVPTSEDPWALFVSIVFSVAVAAVPAGIGIGMLRHDLYDIDRALVRALTMAALAGVVTLAYLGAATALGALIGSTVSPQPIFAIGATAVIALAFQPARTQAHRLAARLIYGRRAAPYEVLSDFGRRIADTEHVPQVLDRMAGLLQAATGAQSASVWLRTGNEFRALITRPLGVPPKAPVQVTGSEQLATLDGHHALVRHGGRQLGALSVTLQQGQELSPTEARLLSDLANQAGPVLRNAQLSTELERRVEELVESRARIVTTQDAERRRLERDLHDGAQQSLVVLRMGLAEVANALERESAAAAAARLVSLDEEAARAASLLRDLARGIFPQALVERGLRDALEGQLAAGPLEVTVDAAGVGRFDPRVETAVYFCCLEALQNVQKHGGVPAASVRLQADAVNLVFEISDAGRGFDPNVPLQGSGIVNMRDRIGALSGQLEVRSAPGLGTTVRGRIPIPADGQS